MAGGARLVLVLTENWTLVPPSDPLKLVDLSREAEAAGIDTVMLSEHIVMGPSAGADGVMGNPRDYALPGNQDPATPWPSSIVLISAIAAATSRLRLAAAAILAPLRHPLLLARELGTIDLLSRGRLVVLPSVGWHRDEYESLGVDFKRRGRLLDEQLAIMRAVWAESPSSFAGELYQFENVWLEPKAYRPSGPEMWFGGGSVHPALVRRLTEYGDGFNPLGTIPDEGLEELGAALRSAGRDPVDLELVGGVRGSFPDDESTADLAEAIGDSLPAQLARGYSTFCFKPNQFIDDVENWTEVCEEAVARTAEVVAAEGGIEVAHRGRAKLGLGGR